MVNLILPRSAPFNVAFEQRLRELGYVERQKLARTRYPEYTSLPMPKPEEIAVYRVLPKVISVLDYSKGFGHSDLVTVGTN